MRVRIKVILSDHLPHKQHHCQKKHNNLLFTVYHKHISSAVKRQRKASISLAWLLGEGFLCLGTFQCLSCPCLKAELAGAPQIWLSAIKNC